MPTHTEVSSRFAESRGRGLLFTTVVVCFDDASEVMQVQVGIGDSGCESARRLTQKAGQIARRFTAKSGGMRFVGFL